MNYNKYTLDRFDGEYAIFLKRPNETEQLLIHHTEIPSELKEGDIVHIKDDGFDYKIELLKEETENQKTRVNNLLQQLKNKE
ncbi:DUF3006 domain-containing protein [Solibacillus sp. FSL W7-1464]|uniref:DUF3006 domain-containing protein n=1 Tax=Solibacillus sp. FSL W7-1464 TaxID=2921706 RepID=UPI0030FAEE56